MTDSIQRVLVDAAAFLVVVAIGTLAFDDLLLGLLSGLLAGGGAVVAQRRS